MAARWIVTKKDMMPGWWRIVDTTTGATTQAGFRSKRAAQDICDYYRIHGRYVPLTNTVEWAIGDAKCL